MKKIKKKLLVILFILLAIFLALNIYFDTFLNNMERNYEKYSNQELEVSEEFNSKHRLNTVVNICLFGVDNDENEMGSLNEARSDATKIISLNYITRKIKITSLERDLVVYMPGEYQEFGHLNWAYSYGGPKLAMQTINYNFDLDINKYVTISFGALEKIVDLVGGVDVYLTAAEINQTKMPLDINGPEGTYTLSGYQALRYCRIRYIDSDFARMDRQNVIINAVINKIKKANPLKLINIINDIIPYVNTNLSNTQIKRYMLDYLLFDTNNIETFKEPSGEYDDIYSAYGIGGYLVRDYVGMISNLHKNIYGIDNYVPSSRIEELEINAKNRYGY